MHLVTDQPAKPNPDGPCFIEVDDHNDPMLIPVHVLTATSRALSFEEGEALGLPPATVYWLNAYRRTE